MGVRYIANIPTTIAFSPLLMLLLVSVISSNDVHSNITASAQTSFQKGTYNIVEETVNIIPGKLWYYSFYANSPATNMQLTGSYQELNGNEVIVTLYDSQNSNIYNDIDSSASISLLLTPGVYFLGFKSADNQDITVNLDFNVQYDFPVDVDEQPLDDSDGGTNNGDDGDGEEIGSNEGSCLQGPGGCGGAFDLGYGPYSPLNPNFGMPYNPFNP